MSERTRRAVRKKRGQNEEQDRLAKLRSNEWSGQSALVLTFKALNSGGGAPLLAAPCTLSAPRKVECRYAVTAGDVGRAASGVIRL
ncbi:hypothetical protein [Deinococcus sp. PESE-13]